MFNEGGGIAAPLLPSPMLGSWVVLQGGIHGLNNYEDTKPLMSSLLVFNRVYKLEIQSVMLAFSTGFVNYCLSYPLSG